MEGKECAISSLAMKAKLKVISLACAISRTHYYTLFLVSLAR